MSHPGIDRRIFVVGVPRSGTTLVQSLLAAHSQVTSFTESHFFSRHFTLTPWSSSAILTRDPTARLHGWLVENGLIEDDVELSGLAAAIEEPVRQAVEARFCLPLRTHAVARHLLQALDEMAVLRGQSNWIEKTPKHLRYIPFLEKILAEDECRTHFVHVIRSGVEVVASLHTASKSWDRPYDLETCVKRWNADVGFSVDRVTPKQGASPPTDHFVIYEELTSRPEATLEGLLDELDLGWEPEILERYSSSRLVTREESWKANVDRGVRASATSERVLSAEQREQINAALRHDLYTQLVERIAR